MAPPKRKKTGAGETRSQPHRRAILGSSASRSAVTPLLSSTASTSGSSSRVGPGSMAPPDEKEKIKISRQSFSCAECKRLKLKCSRTWPCESCDKRGCAQICPNGTIRTGKGKRLILADTEELHQRISTLEVALAQSQAQTSNEPHPLLAEAYLFSPIEAPLPRPSVTNPAEQDLVAKQEAVSPAFGARSVPRDKEDVVDSAFGTLTLGRAGQASFVGSFAGSEYLRAGTGDGREEVAGSGLRAGRNGRGVISGLNTPPSTAAVLGDGFDIRLLSPRSGPPAPGFRIGGYPDDRDADVDELRRELPDWEREGRDLVQAYWDNVSVMHQIIPQHIFESQYIQQAYTVNFNIHPHKLAVVFLVMAAGVIFDLHRPPFDERGAELFALGQSCLSAVGLEHATLSTIRALLLSGTFVLNDRHGSGAEIYWPVLGTAIKVAYSLGIHRDGSSFGLSTRETEERRLVWWELVSSARLQATCFARPAGISGRDTDTQMPEAHDCDSDNYHHTKYRLVELMEKVNKVQTQIAPVPYSLVKSLDAELVEFKKTFPETLLPAAPMSVLPSDSTLPPHLVFHRLTIRLLLASNRLLLSRPFFSKALAENPEDPSFCDHGESFEALFEAAQEIIQVVQHLMVYHPSLVARWWTYWFHAFSSACCFAAIAIRAPKSAFAAPAYDGLIAVFDLATATPPGCRAKKGLPVLVRLQKRAQDSMRKAGRHGALNASFLPNRPGRLAPYIPSSGAIRRELQGEGEDDDLGHLSGRSKLKRVKESHVRSNAAESGGKGAERYNEGSTSGQQYAGYSPTPQAGPSDYSTINPGAYGVARGKRSRAGTGTYQDFMVSPSSVISAATTLAERPWDGVVPPPPAHVVEVPVTSGTGSLMADGMTGGGFSAGMYDYGGQSMVETFPTLMSGPTYPQHYPQHQPSFHHGHNTVWSPPGTTSSLSSAYYPATINPLNAGAGGGFGFAPMPGSLSSGLTQAYESQLGQMEYGQGQNYDLGIDMDMGMALGFGEGMAGEMSSGAWDWENLINGTGAYA